MRIFFLIAMSIVIGRVSVTQAAAIPYLYGSAYEREDTGIVDLSSFFYLIDRNDTSIPQSDIALHFADINLPQGRMNSRSSITLNGIQDSTSFLQACSFALPFASSTTRIGVGYNPRRIRRYEYTLPSTTLPDRAAYEETSITTFNDDNLTFTADGVIDFSSFRHLFFGTGLDFKQRHGYNIYHIREPSSEFNPMNYTELTMGNNRIDITAGIGYWRDFQRNFRQLKYICLLEGYYSRAYQPLHPNADLFDWLLETSEPDSDTRYTLFNTGYTRRRGIARLRWSLSDRFTPSLPSFHADPDEGKQRKWFLAIEKIEFAAEYAFSSYHNYKHRTYSDISFSSGSHYYTRSPYEYSDHRLKLYRILPFSTSRLNSYLFGKIVYRSRSTGSIEPDAIRIAQWQSTVNLWFGSGILFFDRVLVEVSYSPYNAYFLARYHSRTGKSFDMEYNGTRWAFDVRLLR